MSFAICYWILMLLWFVFRAWAAWPSGAKASGPDLILFLLLALLGWQVFGQPLHN